MVEFSLLPVPTLLDVTSDCGLELSQDLLCLWLKWYSVSSRPLEAIDSVSYSWVRTVHGGNPGLACWRMRGYKSA